MKFKQVTLFGATGLIGGYLLEFLLKDSEIHLINVVGRNPFHLQHDKINNIVIDFEDVSSISNSITGSEAVFVSIGTTMSKVNGDKIMYKSVDFDIIFNIANACKQKNINQFIYVSSLGANPNSSNFYLRLKGEIDEAVAKLNLNSTYIFRPSILLGKRNESRPGEKIMQFVMPLLDFMIPSNSKAIKAEDVAKSMLNTIKNYKSGLHIYQYNQIKEL
ncbi:NAD(P)H-binding protein [Flavobacteriaceae bacterium]|nr:NAD(P)H-binding protein [Flavobacteriales bacterium]MBL6878198.1 NAD(P)H-binding protein [Flavobacteriaceae bacterium]MDA8626337.1 NAD(P)H-binding protein [Flavobacteriaceae bacterium]